MKVLVCSHCSGVNPPGALYCHRDGLTLDHAGAGPIDAGSKPFITSFVFPCGRGCRSFDELVLAAEEHWDEARELLCDGILGVFLSGIGRADLGRLAGQARACPDADQALDDFLNRLPSSARQPPALHVQPQEINLGRVSRLEMRRLILRLANDGMGLLQGTVSSVDVPWLMIGEEPGVPDKHFECRRELSLVVQVLGERMRASGKPLVGKLLVDSGGGTVQVVVRAEVPVEPFPEGVLAGAVTPRQLAEKARGAPKEAAVLFDGGAVRRWYEDNGWDYPIQGPQALGLGAVQQFFEALGLTVPPRLEISELAVKLAGAPGEALNHTVKVTAIENRPVFAHAASEVPWLTIGRISCIGKTAKVRLVVPRVPDQPGESLLGRVQIHANGGQRFTLAVFLRVAGRRRDEAAPAAGTWPANHAHPANGEQVDPEPLFLDPSLVRVLDPPPTARLGVTLAAPLADDSDDVTQPFDFPPVSPSRGEGRGARAEQTQQEPTAAPAPVGPRLSAPAPRRQPFWPHLVGPGVILLVLAVALLHDGLLPSREQKPPSPVELADPNPHLALRIHDGPKQNRPEVMPRPTMRFGLVMMRELNPAEPGRLKRLTFDEWGRSNNTCLRVDGAEVLFGDSAGTWGDRYRPLGKDPETGREVDGFESVWRLNRLQVTQRVEIVPGRQSRCLDTCLIRYSLVNRDTDLKAPPLLVGLRFLLDTFVGSVDGVPWTLPGQDALCDTRHAFDVSGLMPDFIEALERDELNDPGAVARVSLRLGRKLEPPSRGYLGAWPSRALKEFGHRSALDEMTLWDVPYLPMRELHDRIQERLRQGQVRPEVAAEVKPNSAVTLYWEEKALAPGVKREVGFAYGLGQTSPDPAGKLLLSLGGRFVPGGEVTLVAVSDKPAGGETLSLTLPEGFDLMPGSRAQQSVPPVVAAAVRPHSAVTWRFRAGQAGTYTLRIQSSTGASRDTTLLIYAPQREGVVEVFE
jgi:hypothetical protein